MEITNKSFWEKYWGEIMLPQKVDYNFKNDRVIAQSIEKYIPNGKNKLKALEIGCAPGKWMIFLYEKLNYKIDGLEYIDIASKKTIENLTLCDIPEESFNVIRADFLKQKPNSQYDLLLSLGFIEHFDNYSDIFNKHLAYTKKDGYVVIGFPNFRGINYYIQLFIDRVSGSKIIENHNISMMDKKIMENMINDKKKSIVFIDYIGGFEFALFNLNDIKNFPLRVFMKIFVKSLSIICSKTKNRYISSYLLFIIQND